MYIFFTLLLPLYFILAKSATDLLKSTNHTQFMEMLEKTGMGEVIDKLEDVTLFVPSERGLTGLKEKLDSLTAEELKQLVSYHIVPQRITSGDFNTDEKIPTLNDNKALEVSLVNNVILQLCLSYFFIYLFIVK